MSKPANAVAIGGFVVGAFVILFSMLFLLSGDLFSRNVEQSLVVFDGSIKGLNVGAPVAFKGVPIGEVSEFSVVVDPDTYEVVTPVLLRINTDRIRYTDEQKRDSVDINELIERGLRAQLQVQSLLTGLLYVQFDFHPGTPERFNAQELHDRVEIDKDIIIVPTIPTGLERLANSLQDLDFGKLSREISQTLQGIDRLVNDEDLQAIPERVNATLAAVEDLSRKLEQEVQSLSPDVSALVANANGTMATLNRDLPALSENADQALKDLAVTLETAQQALNNMEYLLSDDSPVLYDLRKAAGELGAAGRSLQSLAETLETQPEALLKGKSQ